MDEHLNVNGVAPVPSRVSFFLDSRRLALNSRAETNVCWCIPVRGFKVGDKRSSTSLVSIEESLIQFAVSVNAPVA